MVKKKLILRSKIITLVYKLSLEEWPQRLSHFPWSLSDTDGFKRQTTLATTAIKNKLPLERMGALAHL